MIVKTKAFRQGSNAFFVFQNRSRETQGNGLSRWNDSQMAVMLNIGHQFTGNKEEKL